jgi:hypothetical protein
MSLEVEKNTSLRVEKTERLEILETWKHNTKYSLLVLVVRIADIWALHSVRSNYILKKTHNTNSKD